jgi:nucleotide-binding universal stress UspA family protein
MERGIDLKMVDHPPSHLLLATDFGARTDRAQDRAVQLALQWNASLTAVHAIDEVTVTDDQSPLEARRTAAHRNAGLLQEEFAAIEGLRASVRVEEGKAQDVLLDVAAKERAELIVTGIAGNGPLGQAIVGSTVIALAQSSPVPLLVVKKKVLDTQGRTVVATDLSEASEPSAQVALRWFSHEKLTLFHAFDPPLRGFVDDKDSYDAEAEVSAIEQCESFLKRVGVADVPEIEIIARRGDAGDLLGILVDERSIDLVVAGTHGRTGLAHVLLGSVASRILTDVACDVLVAPSKRR